MQTYQFSGLSLETQAPVTTWSQKPIWIIQVFDTEPSFYACLTRWKLSTRMFLTKCPALLKSSLWSCHSRWGEGKRWNLPRHHFFSRKKTRPSCFFFEGGIRPKSWWRKKRWYGYFLSISPFFLFWSRVLTIFGRISFWATRGQEPPPQSVRVIYNTWSFPYQKPTCLGFSPPWVTHHEVIYKTRVQMVPKLIKVEQPSKTVYVKKPVPHHVHPKPIYEKVPVVDKDSYDCNQGFLDDGIGLLLGVFWSFFLWVKRCVG